ncbi:MAG: hypothetical protein QNK37_32750 [Acidobacteriota bacterium]|nr:hypothetical protein [Acidobacteriota bacterium]
MSLLTDEALVAGFDAYNGFLARVWASKQEEIEDRAISAAAEALEGHKRFKEISQLVLDFDSPPRIFVERLDDGPLRIIFRIPDEDGWGLSFRARFRKKLPFSGHWHTIKVKIEALQVTISLDIDDSNPMRPRLIGRKGKVRLGDLDLRSTNLGLNLFGHLVSPILEEVAEKMACDAIPEAIPSPEDFARIADMKLADAPVSFEGEGPDPASLAPRAIAVSELLRSGHLPFDSVLDAVVLRDEPGGAAVDYVHFGDSAIWTGHYLAAEAFRFAETGDKDALLGIDHALDAIERLINLSGIPGLLSRVAIPTDSPVLDTLEDEVIGDGQGDRLFSGFHEGREYESMGHITRDQYSGALMGTGIAAMVLDKVPEIRDRARDLALTMIDYLVERQFCPSESVVDPISQTRFTSTTWLGNPGQVLAILQLGRALAPERYTDLFAQDYPMWAANWFFSWLQTFDTHDSYFKFNLENGLAFLLLKLETDAQRREELATGYRVQREALKYHANAWFDAVELATLGFKPELLTRDPQEIQTELRHLLVQVLDRPILMEAPDLTNDPDIEIVDHKNISSDDKEERISRMPVPVVRRPGTDYLWQRSPFEIEPTWPLPEGGKAWRAPGIDRILPYWMTRYLNLA